MASMDDHPRDKKLTPLRPNREEELPDAEPSGACKVAPPRIRHLNALVRGGSWAGVQSTRHPINWIG